MQFVREQSALKNVTVRIPCSDTSDREIYLNRADVREALHVSDQVDYWLPCGSVDHVTIIREADWLLGLRLEYICAVEFDVRFNVQ